NCISFLEISAEHGGLPPIGNTQTDSARLGRPRWIEYPNDAWAWLSFFSLRKANLHARIDAEDIGLGRTDDRLCAATGTTARSPLPLTFPTCWTFARTVTTLPTSRTAIRSVVPSGVLWSTSRVSRRCRGRRSRIGAPSIGGYLAINRAQEPLD